MVRCIVNGCESNKKRPSGGDLPQLHRFPKEKERLDRWIINIGQDIPKDPRICDRHFTDNQFEIDLKVQYNNLFYHYHSIILSNLNSI